MSSCANVRMLCNIQKCVPVAIRMIEWKGTCFTEFLDFLEEPKRSSAGISGGVQALAESPLADDDLMLLRRHLVEILKHLVLLSRHRMEFAGSHPQGRIRLLLGVVQIDKIYSFRCTFLARSLRDFLDSLSLFV